MPRSSVEKSIETRTNIVDSAYHLFLEKGYSATTMREISKRAGVTVGAIYNHFANKEEIWLDVFMKRHPYHDFIEVIKAVKGETTVEVVHSMAYELNRELLNRPDLLNLMFIEIVEFNAKHIPDFYQTIIPEIIPLGNLFQGKHNHLRDIPIPVLIRSFIGLFFSYYILGIFTNNMIEGFTNDGISLNQVVDLYLYGILADDDAARKENSQNEQQQNKDGNMKPSDTGDGSMVKGI